MELVETILQYYLGIYFFYFGLNGFLNFQKIPEPQEQMKNFIQSMDQAKFILPTVKFIELVCGFLFLIGHWKLVGYFLLLPIVFGITVSQILFNLPRGKGITFLTVIPFVLYGFFQHEKILQLVNW